MTAEEYRQKVLTINRGFQMARDMEQCAELAASNPMYLPVLQTLLAEVLEKQDWKDPQCARTLHILIRSGTSSSLFQVLDFIKKMPETVPFSLVELLGNLLPSYKRIVLGPAKELCEFPAGSPQRAAGIQTLCNLHLEEMLPPENLDYLASLLSNFEVDPFFTDYLVDMVRSTRTYRTRNKQSNAEPEEAVYDFLVELNPEANGDR